MKKLLSYMFCVVGLVLVMCGSASAYSPGVYASGTATYNSSGPLNIVFNMSQSASSFWGSDRNWFYSNQIGVPSEQYSRYGASSAILFPLSSFDTFVPFYSSYDFDFSGILRWAFSFSNYTYSPWSAARTPNRNSSNHYYYKVLSSSDVTVSPSDSSVLTLDVSGAVLVDGGSLPLSLRVPSSSYGVVLFGFEAFPSFSGTPDYSGYRIQQCLSSNSSYSLSPVSWNPSYAPYSLESTQLQILSRLDVPLSSIVTAINNLSVAVGTPSVMDKFENDYLGNEYISGQLDKTEQFISPSNSGLPNGGDVAGFAQQIQQGMGFNGSSFDSEKFQQATDAFKVDSTSTGEGGMWWFFSQDVADSLAHDDVATVSDDDGQSLQDAWVEQIKRRWGNW